MPITSRLAQVRFMKPRSASPLAASPSCALNSSPSRLEWPGLTSALSSPSMTGSFASSSATRSCCYRQASSSTAANSPGSDHSTTVQPCSPTPATYSTRSGSSQAPTSSSDGDATELDATTLHPQQPGPGETSPYGFKSPPAAAQGRRRDPTVTIPSMALQAGSLYSSPRPR